MRKASMGWAAEGPYNVIVVSWTKRTLVVSTGFGCIAIMNAVLIAENRPAWLFGFEWSKRK
jgi:hypothetical protein